MTILSTSELAAKLAGGDSYIRTKHGVVRGLAVKPTMNPEAPEVIVVGIGPRVVANAELLAEQMGPVPVYLKQETNAWKFLGRYRVRRFARDTETIERHRGHRSPDKVTGILFLDSEDDVQLEVASSRLGPDPETRQRVEAAAVQFVEEYYRARGYRLTDRQRENRGYDLLATSEHEILRIEVKGTSLSEQRFFLSRNENARSADPHWRLALVTNVLRDPQLEVFDAKAMVDRFGFDPVCWECTPNESGPDGPQS